jgi:hypothetical protein
MIPGTDGIIALSMLNVIVNELHMIDEPSCAKDERAVSDR